MHLGCSFPTRDRGRFPARARRRWRDAVPHGPREDADVASGGERRCLGPARLRRAHRGRFDG